MTRIPKEVAKIIKEAGFKFEVKTFEEAKRLGWGGKMFFTETDTCALLPTYMDVWLWLYREKNIFIEFSDHVSFISNLNGLAMELPELFSDPEEAIISSINYLVNNNLIK